jgi:hypothetical protein
MVFDTQVGRRAVELSVFERGEKPLHKRGVRNPRTPDSRADPDDARRGPSTSEGFFAHKRSFYLPWLEPAGMARAAL